MSSYPGSARTSGDASLASSRESSTSGQGSLPFRVVMLGAAGVGKTSLISQFMTSEYLHAYDTSLGKSGQLSLLDSFLTTLYLDVVVLEFLMLVEDILLHPSFCFLSNQPIIR